MDAATRARVQGLGRRPSKAPNRSALRTFFTSNCMEPGRDLDKYGVFLATGDLAEVKADFANRVARYTALASESSAPAGTSTGTPAVPLSPEAAAAQELYTLTWGPTLAHVPVDGGDLSGTHALSHAISTKPALDFEYAQLLYDAGGEINNRNRYGGTDGCTRIAQIWTPNDRSVVARACEAMKWFLDHGGNVDIADGDGMTPALHGGRTKRVVPALSKLVAERTASVRRVPMGRLLCAWCKVARYCAPETRTCQKIDWPHHRSTGVKVTDRD
ncbi:hypothetical protein B0H13DRAFT_2041377 [Mycena leptocephala]|nr:hypothetical protein B0H13DRAFT_2041377 [Mycena leptocephala]